MGIKKLFSKKGQISMEIAILVFGSILVSTISIYYYISNYLDSHPENVGKVANNTTSSFGNVSIKYANSIKSI
ncbi:class III signal peptide-containing protein [Methanothermococcus okinawensis]|uniref:Class III signal peptide-containing protein n=1 Tax=Methanothermococcus okinawensis (strain DSM 14208 / JCM 11175 / IH1) TaxID=647113 RepID=F8AM54_METOI|nr:class III signal peptide-containing protein [Methanothermococcus okinawensis]AEH06739.1 hypothetical protein Metok_0762 [Methanothermococcus okinawensis IH1]